MGDSHSRKPGSGQGGISPSAPGPSASGKPAAPNDEFLGKSGRVVHDERGNAVWDWIKETSRIAIDSTSRLLKRLEVPELKMEDTQENNELSLEADRDAGGGYNPYGGSTSGGKHAPGRGASGGGSGSGGAASRDGSRPSGTMPRGGIGTSNSGSSGRSADAHGRPNNSGGSNLGGGYDPYGKSVTRKPGR
jgi:hypothetical protein